MLLGARLAVWIVNHQAQRNRIPAYRGALLQPERGTVFHRGEVLKACRRGFTTNCSDGYRVSYCVVRVEDGLRKRDERQVYVGLGRELCHQSMYWDRARAMEVRASEGDGGYEDEHGAGRRKHQLGPEAEVILPRRARGVYVTTWGLNGLCIAVSNT